MVAEKGDAKTLQQAHKSATKIGPQHHGLAGIRHAKTYAASVVGYDACTYQNSMRSNIVHWGRNGMPSMAKEARHSKYLFTMTNTISDHEIGEIT